MRDSSRDNGNTKRWNTRTKKKRIRFENTPRRCIHNSDISQSILRKLHLGNHRSPGDIPLKYPLKRFLTSWPWLLTYELDQQTWPRYSSTWPTCQNSSPYVCPFDRESGNTHTHTHADTQTMSELYYTRHVTEVRCNHLHGSATEISSYQKSWRFFLERTILGETWRANISSVFHIPFKFQPQQTKIMFYKQNITVLCYTILPEIKYEIGKRRRFL